ncbi:MAG: type II secretion system F family protein [Micrococcales bacterium]
MSALFDILGPLAPFVLGLAVFAAILTFYFVVAQGLTSSSREKRLERVLSAYSRTVGAGEAANIAYANAEGIKPGPFDKYRRILDERLAGAGIALTAGLWAGIVFGSSVVIGMVVAVVTGSGPLGVLVFAVAVYYGLDLFLKSRLKAKSKAFNADLPQVLQLIASGLRAGLNLNSAISATATQDKGEVGKQFSRALAETQFGSSLEDALKRVADRMESQDLHWLVMALEIQREVGGSLSGILDGVANTIRSRAEVKREIQVLSAEGILSGYVLIALPIFAFLALLFMRPTYVSFFFTDPLGYLMLGAYVVLIIVGWVWMKAAVRVDV